MSVFGHRGHQRPSCLKGVNIKWVLSHLSLENWLAQNSLLNNTDHLWINKTNDKNFKWNSPAYKNPTKNTKEPNLHSPIKCLLSRLHENFDWRTTEETFVKTFESRRFSITSRLFFLSCFILFAYSKSTNSRFVEDMHKVASCTCIAVLCKQV